MPLRAIRRRLDYHRIKDPSYRFLFDPPPPDEAVAIDCETTGLDRRNDEIVTIAAVKLQGTRILTSERFQALVRPSVKLKPDAIKVHGLCEREVKMGRTMTEVLPELLNFIGARTLVGYYLEFDCAMINRYMRRWLGIELPNPRVEVSGLYYDRKYGDAPQGAHVDLSFPAILADLRLPVLEQHDAYADALMTAMMFLTLRDLRARGVRIARAPYLSHSPFSAG